LDAITPDYAVQVQKLKTGILLAPKKITKIVVLMHILAFTAIIVVFASGVDTQGILLAGYNLTMLGNNSKYVWIGATNFLNVFPDEYHSLFLPILPSLLIRFDSIHCSTGYITRKSSFGT
jgi:hypothetical protein